MDISREKLIENKHLFKQSDLIKTITGQTELVNTAQTVIIYQFTNNTLKYVEEKNQQLLELSEKEEQKLIEEEKKEAEKEVNNEQQI